MSCTNVTPLKLISMSFMVLSFILHTVGITAKRWDYIYKELFQHQFDAYQNLWMAYDRDQNSQFLNTAMYNRITNEIPEWKMQIIYLETTALAIGFYSFLLLVINSTCTIEKRSVHVTMTVLCVLGCIAVAVESILGVKQYLERYMDTLSINGKASIKYEKDHNNIDVYQLAWAPYLCVASGSMFAMVGILLIIDIVVTLVREKGSLTVHPLTV